MCTGQRTLTISLLKPVLRHYAGIGSEPDCSATECPHRPPDYFALCQLTFSQTTPTHSSGTIPKRQYLPVSYKHSRMLDHTIPVVCNMGLMLCWKFWIKKLILNILKTIIAPAAARGPHKAHRMQMPKG